MGRGKQRKRRTKAKQSCLLAPLQLFNPLWWIGQDARSREEMRRRAERERSYRRSHL
jgi:hypothetical protein